MSAQGRCGQQLDGIGATYYCALEHGHGGWHRDGTAEWSPDNADRRALELALDDLVDRADDRERRLELAEQLIRERFPRIGDLDAERYPSVARLRRELARSIVDVAEQLPDVVREANRLGLGGSS